MAQQIAEWVVDLSNQNAEKITSDSTTNAVISNKQSMTAVEWLINNLPERFKNAIINTCTEEIEQAKAMEKEQIIDAYKDGVNLLAGDVESASEYYYNKTYNK